MAVKQKELLEAAQKEGQRTVSHGKNYLDSDSMSANGKAVAHEGETIDFSIVFV